MALLASDDANRDFQGARDPDSVLHVTFYQKPLIQELASEKEGRPIYKEYDFVRIMTPGNQLSVIDTIAKQKDKDRFPRQWAAYKNSLGEDKQVIGTPVAEWPVVGRARAEELRAMKFFTVEQIANCSDAQIQALGMDATTLRQKARAFLLAAQGTAQPQAEAAELVKTKAQLESLNAEVTKMREEMAKMIQAGSAAPKRKYTRKSKETAAA